MASLDAQQTRADVVDYYGKQLQRSEDLLTNACCTAEEMPPHIRTALGRIHEEVLAKYYGCGLVVPDALEGMRVLDLGCGAGRDVFTIAQLVGPGGSVTGVDMTPEQLEVANRHIDWHTERWGWSQSNVEFKHGLIERLDEAGLEDNSFDVVVSNCVINLCPDKDAVLREVYRVLKPGGEMYFSDVYSSRRVPASLMEDKVLWGECLSGALYWNDFLDKAMQAGFRDPRLVKDNVITIANARLQRRVGQLKFFSATFRLWKLPGLLEKDCEDYGQAVVYKGTIPNHPDAWALDNHHEIETGKVFPVCGNTNAMLQHTRFAPHFDFIGDQSTHYGIFPGCGGEIPFASASEGSGGEGSCC